jgi:hypothetical protein
MTEDSGRNSANMIATSAAARLLMVTAERIRQLQKDGYIPKGPRGRVSLVGAVQGYIRFRDDADRRANKSAADSRVRDARAQEIELRNKLRLRELCPVEEAHEVLDTFCASVVAELDGLPARITRDRDLRRKIEEEVRAARLRMIERLQKQRAAAEKVAVPMDQYLS